MRRKTNKMINKKSKSYMIKRDLRKNWSVYLMFLPVLLFFITFSYRPMYGIILAFKKYRVSKGIWGSPWVGFDNFTRFLESYNFGTLIKNTLGISVYSLLVGFPIAIIFALMLNYLCFPKLKKIVQMTSYAPYFISTVVICGMLQIFMDPNTGVFNKILNLLGHESIAFLSEPGLFKSIYVWSGIWQGMGWSAIIYVSALAGVDYEMHEAAIIDGATKIQRIRHIDLPSIEPTIVMLLIMNIGSLMGVGFEKAFLLQNDLNLRSSEIIATYTYRLGLIDNDFSFSTAVGLFNTTINLILLIVTNNVARKVRGNSLW